MNSFASFLQQGRKFCLCKLRKNCESNSTFSVTFLLDFSNMFYVYDLKNNKEIAPKKAVPSGATYEAKIVDNTLEVRVGTDTQTYPLN